MSETCGGCAAISQRAMFAPTSNPGDDLRGAYRQRQTVKQENRKNELLAKKEDGGLSQMEQIELTGLRAQENLEKLAQLGASTICYSC